MLSKKPVATFYSGIGGCDWGLKQAGYEVVFGVEYDPRIAKFYRLNHPTSELFNCKVEDKDFSEFRGKIWGVHGSPPCQNFSSLRDPKLPTRSDAGESFNFFKAISQIMPVYVTLENVVKFKYSRVFDQFCDQMCSIGYYAIFSDQTSEHQVFNYADLGGCQNRNRLIARWVRGDSLGSVPIASEGSELFGNKHVYCPTFQPSCKPAKSWFDLVKPNIPKLKKWELKDFVKKHLKPEWFRPNSFYLVANKENRTMGRTQNYKGVDQLAATLCTASQFVLIQTPEVIETKNQFLTDLNCWWIDTSVLKLFQGFPDEAVLSKSEILSKKMIGNSLPPAMIAGIWSKFQ